MPTTDQRGALTKSDSVAIGTIRASLALGGQVARIQARLNRTSINKELALYTVHGLLHLLGYNDAKPADARRMHHREDELLQKLGIGAVFQEPAP